MSETGNQNLPVVEAKSEYTKNLKVAISDVIADEINTVYENSVQEAEQKNQVLMTFQKNLKRVLDWSNNHMNMILEKIQKNCSWFNELLTAVIVTNVKILTSVKISKSSKKVQVKMPSPEKFLHQVIIHVARKVYSDPYVVSEKNTKQLYQIIDESVEKTIRDTLPIANILQMYVGDGMDSDEEEEEAEETNDESDDEEENKENFEDDSPEDPFNETGNDSEPEHHDDDPLPEPEPEPEQPSGFFDPPPSDEIRNVNLSNTTQPPPMTAQQPPPMTAQQPPPMTAQQSPPMVHQPQQPTFF